MPLTSMSAAVRQCRAPRRLCESGAPAARQLSDRGHAVRARRRRGARAGQLAGRGRLAAGRHQRAGGGAPQRHGHGARAARRRRHARQRERRRRGGGRGPAARRRARRARAARRAACAGRWLPPRPRPPRPAARAAPLASQRLGAGRPCTRQGSPSVPLPLPLPFPFPLLARAPWHAARVGTPVCVPARRAAEPGAGRRAGQRQPAQPLAQRRAAAAARRGGVAILGPRRACDALPGRRAGGVAPGLAARGRRVRAPHDPGAAAARTRLCRNRCPALPRLSGALPRRARSQLG